MAEQDVQTPAPHAAERSEKLTKAVIWLAILPLVLPIPFYGIAHVQIGPMENEAWSHCGFDCPGATYWERIFWLVVLGPSMLVAVASILLGTIGLIRARRHPTSPENINLLQGSIISGVVWAIILGGYIGSFFG